MEKNTSQPYGEDPSNYIAGLIEHDYMIDERELLNAEFNLEIDSTNLYWKGRVSFLAEKIKVKKELIASVKAASLNLNREQGENPYTWHNSEEQELTVEQQGENMSWVMFEDAKDTAPVSDQPKCKYDHCDGTKADCEHLNNNPDCPNLVSDQPVTEPVKAVKDGDVLTIKEFAEYVRQRRAAKVQPVTEPVKGEEAWTRLDTIKKSFLNILEENYAITKRPDAEELFAGQTALDAVKETYADLIVIFKGNYKSIPLTSVQSDIEGKGEEQTDTHKCSKCGGRTALITGFFHYEPDSEPYMSGVYEDAKVDIGECWMGGYKCDDCGNVQDFWTE